MRILIVLCAMYLLTAGAAQAEGEKAAQEREETIANDCHVAGTLAVELMRHKGKDTAEQLQKRARDLLSERGYRGALGEASFVAYMYTGLALQMTPEDEWHMAQSRPEDLELIALNHEIECYKGTMERLAHEGKKP